MKNTFSLSRLIAVLFFFLVLQGCKKISSSNDDAETPLIRPSEKEVTAIKDWLTIQKIETGVEWIDALAAESPWNEAQKVNYKDSVNFIVVPISTPPITVNFSAPQLRQPNADTKQYLLFSIDNSSRIKQPVLLS